MGRFGADVPEDVVVSGGNGARLCEREGPWGGGPPWDSEHGFHPIYPGQEWHASVATFSASWPKGRAPKGWGPGPGQNSPGLAEPGPGNGQNCHKRCLPGMDRDGTASGRAWLLLSPDPPGQG